jgi:pimeloyl-ACP methyl ester carboxylesterase
MEGYMESFDGLKIFYRHTKIEGRKPTLVFLHGLGANWTLWKDEMLLFERRGYSTLSYDMRGHGLSGIPDDPRDYFLPNFTKDLHTLLKHTKVRSFILIGHSMGGGIAIGYCGLFKKRLPKSMILFESAYRYPFSHGREFGVNPFVSSFLRFIAEHEPFRKKNYPHLKDMDLTCIKDRNKISFFLEAIQITPLKSIINTIDEVQKYSFNHLQDTEELLSKLKLPVMIVAGSEDSVLPLHFSEELHWLIKNSKLKVMMGAYHRAPLEQPEEVCQEILSFIERKKR